MKQTKCNLNFWPYAITATAIFAVFKMNGTIDWSWFKVLLPVIVLLVLDVVASLAIIALSLYKVKRDFKKTLEEQIAAAEKRSDDRISLAEKYRAACEELNKNWSRLSPEARTARFERIRNLRELMNTAECVEAMRPAECNECKQREASLELSEDMKVVQTDASAPGELFPVENPDAAMCDFFKDQMNILKEK